MQPYLEERSCWIAIMCTFQKKKNCLCFFLQLLIIFKKIQIDSVCWATLYMSTFGLTFRLTDAVIYGGTLRQKKMFLIEINDLSCIWAFKKRGFCAFNLKSDTIRYQWFNITLFDFSIAKPILTILEALLWKWPVLLWTVRDP